MPVILYINALGEISGAERSLLAMLDALDRTRWTPVVAAPDGPLLREVEARAVRAYPLPLARLHRPGSLPDAWELLSALRQGRRQVTEVVAHVRPDLLHANTTTAMLYSYHLPHVPCVWHVRDLVPLGMWGGRLYHRASRVAVISSVMRDDIRHIAHDGGARITLLSPAVDTEHFRPAPDRAAQKTRLGLPAHVPLLGMVAQFVPWKRHHLFLDVLEQLTHHTWHAVLAGADLHPDPAYAASLAHRLTLPPLAGRVTRLPWQEDPAAMLAAMDACVLTAQREPFGRVLIEAMACGTPVVAIDEAGPRDSVVPGVTGLLVPAEVPDLAIALETLLLDADLRARIGQAGRLRAIEQFSVARQRDALTALYAQILATPGLIAR